MRELWLEAAGVTGEVPTTSVYTKSLNFFEQLKEDKGIVQGSMELNIEILIILQLLEVTLGLMLLVLCAMLLHVLLKS